MRYLGQDCIKALFLISILISIEGTIRGQDKQLKVRSVIDSLHHLEPRLDGAILSVCAVYSTQKIQFKHAYTLPTASTVKLLTTARALDQLGKNFRFQTLFGYSGQLTSNTLKGHLILRGSGDPSFLSSTNYHEFQVWAKQLQKRHIKTIEGDLIVDASIFENQALSDTWLWEDIGNGYGGGTTGLNILHNIYTVEFAPTKTIGELTTIHRIIPNLPSIIFKNEVRSAIRGSGDQAYIYGGTYSQIRFIRGTIPISNQIFEIKGALPNPPLYAGKLFRKILSQHEIEVKGKIRIKKVKDHIEVLDTVFSAPLSELIIPVNQNSDNLYAESLFKTLGAGSHDRAIKIVEAFLTQISSNPHFKIADGCGLSFQTAMSSQKMVDLLEVLKHKPYFDTFYNSLAVSGKTGTLKHTFEDRRLVGKVHAKSGSMSGLRSYAGYIETPNNDLLSFSIVVYNHRKSSSEIKAIIQEILIWLMQMT